MVEVKVFGLALEEDSQAPVLVLKDLEEKKALPIWIGAMEAMAISMVLNGITTPRPLTHDLLLLSIENLGGRVARVNVTRILDGTYYAVVEVRQGETTISIDARPSDAIALALRAQAAIFVDESVMEKAGIPEASLPVHPKASGDNKKWNEMLDSLDPVDSKYKM